MRTLAGRSQQWRLGWHVHNATENQEPDSDKAKNVRAFSLVMLFYSAIRNSVYCSKEAINMVRWGVIRYSYCDADTDYYEKQWRSGAV